MTTRRERPAGEPPILPTPLKNAVHPRLIIRLKSSAFPHQQRIGVRLIPVSVFHLQEPYPITLHKFDRSNPRPPAYSWTGGWATFSSPHRPSPRGRGENDGFDRHRPWQNQCAHQR